jgi:hypothetical protein
MTNHHSVRPQSGADPKARSMRTIISLLELSLAGAMFTVSLLGVITHAAGTDISLAANVIVAAIGAAGTFTILSKRAHLF